MSSADGFATAGCLSGNTRFGISPGHFVGSSFLIDEGFDAFGIAHRPAGDIRFKTSSIASQFLIPNCALCIMH